MALNKFPTAHCIWGWSPNMTMADFPSTESTPVVLISQAVADGYGQYVAMNARSVQLEVAFQNGNGTCGLELWAQINGVDTKVWSVANLTPTTVDALFVGNVERVDLACNLLKIHVVNPQNGWVTVSARRNS